MLTLFFTPPLCPYLYISSVQQTTEPSTNSFEPQGQSDYWLMQISTANVSALPQYPQSHLKQSYVLWHCQADPFKQGRICMQLQNVQIGFSLNRGGFGFVDQINQSRFPQFTRRMGNCLSKALENNKDPRQKD